MFQYLSIFFCIVVDVEIKFQSFMLAFFQLKSCDVKTIKEETNTLLRELGLNEKRNVQAKKLSGGMKRKLSVLLALIGNSKVITK